MPGVRVIVGVDDVSYHQHINHILLIMIIIIVIIYIKYLINKYHNNFNILSLLVFYFFKFNTPLKLKVFKSLLYNQNYNTFIIS